MSFDPITSEEVNALSDREVRERLFLISHMASVAFRQLSGDLTPRELFIEAHIRAGLKAPLRSAVEAVL